MRSASINQVIAGVRGRAEDAQEYLGFKPTRLASTLSRWPSGVQERWYARLYFFKPLGLATLAGFWAASGLIGLANRTAAAKLLTDAGLGQGVADTFVLAGSVADLALGVLVCIRRAAPFALLGMVAVTAAYLLGATIVLPGLWADPLGPLAKSIPAAILALAALAVMDER